MKDLIGQIKNSNNTARVLFETDWTPVFMSIFKKTQIKYEANKETYSSSLDFDLSNKYYLVFIKSL